MKKGFTLVEVFAMLLIIGVISAITIPSAINKTSQSSLIEQAKKIAATLNQALYNSVITSGEVNTWSWQGENAIANIMQNNIRPRLNVGRDCGESTDSICYYPVKMVDNTESYLEGFVPAARVVLNDGAVVGFADATVLEPEAASCMWAGDPYTICGIFFVDTNGNKKPNTFGKDIYFYAVHLNGSVLPYGATKTAEEVDDGCKKGSPGYTCAAKLAKDGWEACLGSDCTNPYPFAF